MDINNQAIEAEITPYNGSDKPPRVKSTSRIRNHLFLSNILFIIGGFLFLSRIVQGTQILNFIIAPVGVILIFFTPITRPELAEKDFPATLAFSIWILISFLLTIQTDSEILFIVILIGFVIIQELSQDKITQRFQKRMNILLAFFVIIFLFIVIDKIQVILTS